MSSARGAATAKETCEMNRPNEWQRQRSSDNDVHAARKQLQDTDEADDPLVQLPQALCDDIAAVHATVEREIHTEFREEDRGVNAGSGKGPTAPERSRRRMGRDQSTEAATVVRINEHNGRWSESAVALTVVAVVAVVASGVGWWWMFPSSSASTLGYVAACKMEEGVRMLLLLAQSKLGQGGQHVAEKARICWFALIRSRILRKAARAMELHGVVGTVQADACVAMLAELSKSVQEQLGRTLSSLVDTLKLWMQWMCSIDMHVPAYDKAFEQVHAFLVMAFSNFAEAMRQGGERLGLEPTRSDMDLPREQLLDSLAAHQARIQNIGRGLVARESQALHDVQRFEKRRVAIAATTNSIISDTRAVAIESIIDVKTVALQYIEERTQQVAKQYARAIKQALKDYELTSQQVVEEGKSLIVTRSAADNTKHGLSVDDKLVRSDVSQDQAFFDGTLQFQCARDEDRMTGRLAGEGRVSGRLTAEWLRLREQRFAEGVLGSSFTIEEVHQTLIDVARRCLPTVDVTKAQMIGHSDPAKTVRIERVSGELVQSLTLTLSEVAEADQSRLLTNGEGDQRTDGRSVVIAKLAERNMLNVAVEYTDQDDTVGKVRSSIITETAVDCGDALVEVDQTQVEAMALTKVGNVSEEDSAKQEAQLRLDDRADVQAEAPDSGTGMKKLVPNAIGDHSIDQAHPNSPRVDTRVRIVSQAEIKRESSIEVQKIEMTALEQQVDEEAVGVATTYLLNVDVDMDGTTTRLAEHKRAVDEQLVSSHSHVGSITEMDLHGDSATATNEAWRAHTERGHAEKDDHAAILTDADIVTTERMAMTKEFQELKQLEQAVLQEKGVRALVEEELRVIAEEEGLWLHIEQARAGRQDSVESPVSVQRKAAAVDVTKSTETIAGDTASMLPAPTWMHVGLFSMLFLALSALTVHFFVRHRKHGLSTRTPRRGKRWHELADVDSAEEVVLLPDDSSDEDGCLDVTASLKVVEQVTKIKVDATKVIYVGVEEGREKESVDANHNEQEQEHEEEEVEEKDEEAKIHSQSITVERSQTTTTYTVNHPATSNSDDSVNDGDSATASTLTPPNLRHETPDTSERRRHRRHGIRT
ncbi:unnamed protein product [Hyaloperonospora brassicae]|uniref:Uncharacterized protein n=1 Tax=Hyaloperonospora brassicae TaxID=162125 RepID=A0AAV0UNE6_HYABA|nr:unnamed protein product [Hyaloperonospora brassicae]